MFELLPDVGLRLPGCAGTLRFGMDERTAQWAVATVADVRDGWVCGARWAFSAQYRGLTLDAYGDTTGRSGGHQDAAGLAGIGLSRDPSRSLASYLRGRPARHRPLRLPDRRGLGRLQ